MKFINFMLLFLIITTCNAQKYLMSKKLYVPQNYSSYHPTLNISVKVKQRAYYTTNRMYTYTYRSPVYMNNRYYVKRVNTLLLIKP